MGTRFIVFVRVLEAFLTFCFIFSEKKKKVKKEITSMTIVKRISPMPHQTRSDTPIQQRQMLFSLGSAVGSWKVCGPPADAPLRTLGIRAGREQAGETYASHSGPHSQVANSNWIKSRFNLISPKCLLIFVN